jgi:hypothetical protein
MRRVGPWIAGPATARGTGAVARTGSSRVRDRAHRSRSGRPRVESPLARRTRGKRSAPSFGPLLGCCRHSSVGVRASAKYVPRSTSGQMSLSRASTPASRLRRPTSSRSTSVGSKSHSVGDAPSSYSPLGRPRLVQFRLDLDLELIQELCFIAWHHRLPSSYGLVSQASVRPGAARAHRLYRGCSADAQCDHQPGGRQSCRHGLGNGG